jgi:hypothetical protein
MPRTLHVQKKRVRKQLKCCQLSLLRLNSVATSSLHRSLPLLMIV